MKQHEIRFTADCLEVREAGENGEKGNSRTITGRAIVFNEPSVVLDECGLKFTEYIAPSACTKEFLASQDIKLNCLHDRNQTIARVGGNLRLDVREDGVYFTAELPEGDIYSDRCLAMIRAGVFTGCSFEFYPKDYDVKELPDDTYEVTHRSFEALTALTVGMDPAYPTTSINAREVIERAEAEEREELTKKQKAEEVRKREVESLRRAAASKL